jgi:NAD-dependent deacetylase
MIDDVQMLERQIRQAVDAIVRTRRMVVFTGPGLMQQEELSAFQEPPGQWNSLERRELASLAAFEEDWGKVWRWYHEQRKLLEQTLPSPAYYSLVELERLMDDFLLITQTVDGLHRKAGSKSIVELRGNLWIAQCLGCDYRTDTENTYLDEEPMCPRCGARLRLGVVWPDEALPEEPFSIALEAMNRCELMLNIGVDAEVQPAASLIWQAKSAGAFLIEINPKTTPVSGISDIHLTRYPGAVLPVIMEELKSLMESASVER